MNEVKIISPSANLIDAVLDEFPRDTESYTKSVVVFPGKRPAHFLRKALAERMGKSFFPPTIFSIDNFITYLFTEKLGIGSLPLEPIDAVAILYDIHCSALQKIGHDHYRSFDHFLPIGLQLFQELEEVMLTHLPVQHVHSILQKIEYPKFHSLSFYYEQFYAEADRRGYHTRSVIYKTVADRINEIDLTSYERIILAGFYAFTKTETIIVRGLSKNESVRLIVQHGIGIQERLKDLGMTIPLQSDEIASDPTIHFYRSPDTHGQVFALAAKLQEHLQSGKPINERTVIILPSAEALFPVLHYALSLIPNENYNISLGYPLSRTPAYGFLNSLLELVASSRNGTFSRITYLQFVLHPYTKNIRWGTRSDVTRMLFHALEEHLAEAASKTLLSLDDIEGDDGIFELIEKRMRGAEIEITVNDLRQHLMAIHLNTIGKFLGITSIREFALRSIEVLQYVFEESTANLHPFFRPYVERLIEIFNHLSRSLIGDQQFNDVRGYSSFIRSYIASQSVPFTGTPLQGIQVLGLLETRNLSFDTVFFLDVNDDVLPGVGRPDMLLPYPVRNMLGLETSHDREQLSTYFFDLVVGCAKEVHLFYTEAGKKEKSRFVEKFIWKRQLAERTVSSKPFEQQVKYSVNLANRRPAPVSKTEAIVAVLRNKFKHSAWTLNTYLDCPLKFYYQNILGLRERIEVSDDIDASEVGTLIHTVLKEYFSPLLGVPLTMQELSIERLETVVNRCVDEIYGHDAGGPAYFLRRQIQSQLRTFLEKYQRPIVSNQRVIISAIERDTVVDYKGHRFSGRIDRIELRDGVTVILDYKTGYDEKAYSINAKKMILEDRSTWGDAIHSFQLPMYILLHAAFTQTSTDTIRSAYLFLGKNNINESIEIGMGDDHESSVAIYHDVERVMFALIDEMLNIQLPFHPTQDLEQHCPRCPYSTICGTQWVRGWEGQ